MTKIIDVTVPLSADLATYPGDPPFQMESVRSLERGDAYRLTRFSFGSHAGTHVDAPAHFVAGGATVDQLPLELLMGKALVVALPAVCSSVDRSFVDELDLENHIRLLIRTRNSSFVRRREFATDFVHLTADAAQALVDVGIKMVGVDYFSVDAADSHEYAAHRILLGAGVIIVEGLDLTEADPGEYDVTCLPLRIEGADGAPARVVLRRRL